MVARQPRRQSEKQGMASRCASVVVRAEERQHLIEDCAFFRSDHFRDAEPGSIRQSDRVAAAAEIKQAIKARRKTGGKR